MPSQIETTTPAALEAAIIETIRALEPELEEHRSQGWIPVVGNDTPEGESSVPRLFAVELMDAGPIEGGITGGRAHEAELDLDVVVSYGPFDAGLGTVISSDVWDVHDALTNAINTIPGLTFIERQGRPEQDGDLWVLPFTARYMRARRL